jgi:hypothetical protein
VTYKKKKKKKENKKVTAKGRLAFIWEMKMVELIP